jgi:nitrile hydratase subunit alpha
MVPVWFRCHFTQLSRLASANSANWRPEPSDPGAELGESAVLTSRQISPPLHLGEKAAYDPSMSCDHDHADHGHHHDHDHGQEPPSDPALRVKAIESLLVEKGVVDARTLDAIIDHFRNRVGPRNGARVVATAWTDPDYKARLMTDATAAIAELGYAGAQGEHMRVVENTPEVHNLVVCTLCSCYPWPVLGLPPSWYKSAPYRSRAVLDPRGVLREFGVELPAAMQVRVWDSTAELRYLVLPERPEASAGMSAEALAEMITRDGMIGTARL